MSKGPIANAQVSIYKIDTDGLRGDLIAGPFETNPSGETIIIDVDDEISGLLDEFTETT